MLCSVVLRNALIFSVVLDPGQTRPSMDRVSMGRKVNGLTDPSVERCYVTSNFAAMVRIHVVAPVVLMYALVM
jgi:hypothetical protein